jgi:SAM-dependent methyltransferase
MARLSGTEGYGQEAATLLKTYESVSFEKSQERVLPFLPAPPARLLDIGAGTGRDAAGFAALGYDVVAAEPTDEMREGGKRLHAGAAIEWLDDGLPELGVLRGRSNSFDVVMMTAVWMHLDQAERRRGLPNVTALLRPRGILAMTLRAMARCRRAVACSRSRPMRRSRSPPNRASLSCWRRTRRP